MLRAQLLSALTAAALTACAPAHPHAPPVGHHHRAAGPAKTTDKITIDQFGYRPADPKVAVLVDPQQGFNASASYAPGSTIEVRRWSDGKQVFSGAIKSHGGGATQSSSGDRGWHLDFSALKTPGSYYLYDAKNKVGSHRFEIDEEVYRPVLRAAARMFFYNRCGQAKQPPHAEAKWQDTAAYLGAGQDSQARSVSAKGDATTALDLRGGWFDAGDTNKYVTFANSPVHQLLTAYEENPGPFTDDFGLPESGNGVPDLLDEVKWEVDWIKRMQRPDGGVLIKVGVLDHNSVAPPGQDKRPRYYAPPCSSSSIVAAGLFAHAALVLGQQASLKSYATDLKQRAVKAWDWYGKNAKKTDCDSQEIKSGDADVSTDDQHEASVVAAVYLFALTGGASYHNHIKSNYKQTRPYEDIGWSRYEPEQGDALLYYTTLSGADAAVKQAILSKKKQDAAGSSEIYGAAALAKDLYRAHITDSTYHWGSHNARCNVGNSNTDMLVHKLDSANAASYRARALGIVHYLHGVNPLGLVYLSNMYSLGAEASVNEIYHVWFADKSAWDNAKTSTKGPAPGYLVGGPNKSYSGQLSPPKGQPAQKSYKDWNTGWPENSWEVTEPGIYYQAAYLKLLSKFVGPPKVTPPTDGGGSKPDGSAPLTDAGAADGDAGGSASRDAASGDANAAGTRPDDGCGCRVAGPRRFGLEGGMLLALLALAWALHRRRR